MRLGKALPGRTPGRAARAVPGLRRGRDRFVPGMRRGDHLAHADHMLGLRRGAARRRALRPSDPSKARAPRNPRLRASMRGRGVGRLLLLGVAASLRNARGPDLREVDHRHGVLVGDVAVVELAEEHDELVERAQLGVVVLELARRDIAETLDLDLVDHGVEDVRARAEALTAEHLEAQALAVLDALVAEADRDRLAPAAQLIGDQGVVEVERLHGAESTGVTERR